MAKGHAVGDNLWKDRGVHEAVRIALFKNVAAKTVGNGKAAAANRPNGTGLAPFAAGTIATGYLGVIDLGQALLKDIADEGWKLPAGVDFSI